MKCFQFYCWLMTWSKKLYYVSLLDSYVGPTPVVSGLVRSQLRQRSEKESIWKAIKHRIVGKDDTSIYFLWLSYSGIDFEDSPAALASMLQNALFDMNLGRRVNSYQLNFYSEVHEVRDSIKGFFVQVRDLVRPAPDPGRSLWWDGISSLRTPHGNWISATLGEDPDFRRVFQSWLDDSEWLQHWLDDFEAKTTTVNNPGSSDPVFSKLSATGVIEFAEVHYIPTNPIHGQQTNI